MSDGARTTIWVVAGAMVGALAGVTGFFVGAVIGLLIGRERAISRRLKNIEQNQPHAVQAWLAEARQWTRDVHAWLMESVASKPSATTDELAHTAAPTPETQPTPTNAPTPETEPTPTNAPTPETEPTPADVSPPESAGEPGDEPDASERAERAAAAAHLAPPSAAAAAHLAPPSAAAAADLAPPSAAAAADLAPPSAAAAADLAPPSAAAAFGARPAATARVSSSQHAEKPGTKDRAAYEEMKPPFDPFQWLADRVKKLVTTGNVPVKVGVVVSLIGVGLLLREANRRGLIEVTIEARLAAAAAFGLVLLAIGWRQRKRRPEYGLALQGGGVAVLYITLFASYAVYDVLAAVPAGVGVAAVTIGAGVLAVVEDSRVLAILGMIGGFLAPVLTYSEPEDHVWVFGLFAVLNAGIFAITWFKSWPELNLLGFVFTFSLSAFWLWERSDTEQWASTQPFIGFFVLLYMTMPTVFAMRRAPDLKALWTGAARGGDALKDLWMQPVVYGTPFIGLGLQELALGHTEYGMAITSASQAGALAVLALIAYKIGSQNRSLAESYAHLAVVFAALAVPLAFDTFYTSTVWAAQGYVLLRLGCRRNRRLLLGAGIVLQSLAAFTFGDFFSQADPFPYDELVIVNQYYLGALLISLAGLLSAWHLHKRPRKGELDEVLPTLALAWGIGWWLGSGLTEIASQLPAARFAASLGFVAVSLGAAGLVARRLKWPALEASGLFILPSMILMLLIALSVYSHPLDRWGWIGWPVAFGVYYAFLRLREDSYPQFHTTLHIAGYWTLAVVAVVEAQWQIDSLTEGASPLFATQAAMLLLLAVAPMAGRGVKWPVAKHWRSYLGWCSGLMLVVAAFNVAWLILGSNGDPDPLPYLPVLNPLMVLAVAVAIAFRWWRKLAKAKQFDPLEGLKPGAAAAMLAAAAIVTLTMETARSVHHWDGVAWNASDLIESTTLQSSLSVLWAAIGLSGMIAGVRTARRVVWSAGAALMGLVVVKLFLIDLRSLAAVSRVVSFLGVGVLLLIVGYFAPVPPAASSEPQTETQPQDDAQAR